MSNHHGFNLNIRRFGSQTDVHDPAFGYTLYEVKMIMLYFEDKKHKSFQSILLKKNLIITWETNFMKNKARERDYRKYKSFKLSKKHGHRQVVRPTKKRMDTVHTGAKNVT